MTLTHDNGLLEGSLFKKILLFSLPLMAANVLQLLYNAADMMVVGQWSGPEALAAVSSTGPVTGLMINLFCGLAVGANVILSRYIGANSEKDISETVHTAITLSVVLGIFLAGASFFFIDSLLRFMSCPEDVLPLSSVYLKIFFLGSPANLLYNYGSNILRTEGDTKSPLYFLTVSGIVNVILNIILVAGFRLDTIGVAAATVVSQYISAILVIITLIRRTTACRLSFKKLKIHPDKLGKMLYFGIPASLQSVLFSLSNILIQSTINTFGTTVVAGSGAASNVDSIIYGAMNSFVQAALIYTGYAIGAKQVKKIKNVTIACLSLIMLAWLASLLLIVIFKNPILKIFLPDTPEAMPAAYTRLRYLAYPYFLCAVMETFSSLLRGMGKSVMPMIITLIGVCVLRVAWIYLILPFNYTLGFLYLSYPVTWIITTLILLACYIFVYKNILKVEENEHW